MLTSTELFCLPTTDFTSNATIRIGGAGGGTSFSSRAARASASLSILLLACWKEKSKSTLHQLNWGLSGAEDKRKRGTYNNKKPQADRLTETALINQNKQIQTR